MLEVVISLILIFLTLLLYFPNVLGKFPNILIIYDSVANTIEKKKANYELHVVAIVI